jgi:rhamnose transport system ATP-binding protein
MNNPSVASNPVIQLRSISKRFGAVQALSNVDLDLFAGEVHALVGENGAGKSTLVKILAGVTHPDSGTVSIQGRAVNITGPARARELGVAVIHQHANLFPDLTIAENVFIADMPRRSGRIDWRGMRARATELFETLGAPMRVTGPVRGLGVADQQLIEIAKALSADARVVVMDEPTASLSPREVNRLRTVIAQLRDRGAAILFVSHRLEEVFDLSQRVTVLRDGAHVVTLETHQLTPGEVIRHMVGRSVDALFPKPQVATGEAVLEVDNVSRAGAFQDVSLTVHKGEIVGLAGLVGAGRTEVARCLFGIDRADSGEVRIGGKAVSLESPNAAMRAGLVYVPEDRHAQGLVLDFSVAQNVSLPLLRRLYRLLLVGNKEERLAVRYIDQLSIKTQGPAQPVAALSGGNQQKVVIAKWLAAEPRVLILDEPTQGVDIGAKADVHRIIGDLAAAGMAVLLISSELPEILGMSDRILVMHDGRIEDELSRDEATQEKVMFAATGHQELAISPVVG